MINSRSTRRATQIPARTLPPPKRLWPSLGIPSRPRDEKESSEKETFWGRIQNHKLLTDLLFSLYGSWNARMKTRDQSLFIA